MTANAGVRRPAFALIAEMQTLNCNAIDAVEAPPIGANQIRLPFSVHCVDLSGPSDKETKERDRGSVAHASPITDDRAPGMLCSQTRTSVDQSADATKAQAQSQIETRLRSRDSRGIAIEPSTGAGRSPLTSASRRHHECGITVRHVAPQPWHHMVLARGWWRPTAPLVPILADADRSAVAHRTHSKSRAKADLG